MNKILKFEPIALVLAFWIVFALDTLFLESRHFGIIPRQIFGLLGIFTAPFFHANLLHIVSNSIPFIIMGTLVRSYGATIFWQVFIITMLVGGLGTWLFSSAGSVIGASGIVFGFWSFLIVYGIMRKSLQSIAIAIVVAVLYGTMIFSFVSFKSYISWSGHFFGAVGGTVAAWLLAKPARNTI